MKAVAATVLVAVITLTTMSPVVAEEPIGSLPTVEDFVIQQYEDFLSRSPEPAGLAYWSNQVEHGLAPSALVESLALSDEFQGTIAPLVRLYYAHFGRAPDYAGLTHWARAARDGWSMAKISEAFVLSSEFQLTYGQLTDPQYVDLVYLNVLGRSPEAAGRAHWVAGLGQGMTRGELMVAFSESPEYRSIIGSRVLATMLYVGMLRRAPESSGLGYWSSVIDDGTPYHNVIAGFLGAGEYDGRMGGIYSQTQPLTGVPTRAAAFRPALAVKIDNVDRARPQTALDLADLVYEEKVEGSLTRLVAMFHSKLPTVVGPVRSVRTTDLDLLDQFNTPLLAASGANGGVLAQVAAADLINVNALVAGGAYFRQSGRSAPHNMYARLADLYNAAAGRGGQPPQLFRYRTPGTQPAGGVASPGVAIAFGRADIEFRWSDHERGWARSQNGTPHVVANGDLLAPVNVVVLEVSYGISSIDADSPEAHTVGSGVAYVFTAGRRITGTWSRAASDQPIVLRDANSDEIPLTRGQTFIELAPPGTITLL